MANHANPFNEKGPASVALTSDQLRDLITQSVTAAVKVLKEPTAEEAAKLAAEKARAEQRRHEAVTVAKAEEEAKRNLQERCPHTKENGRPSVAGQVHSDGFYHPICLHCMKEFPPIKITAETILPEHVGGALGSYAS